MRCSKIRMTFLILGDYNDFSDIWGIRCLRFCAVQRRVFLCDEVELRLLYYCPSLGVSSLDLGHASAWPLFLPAVQAVIWLEGVVLRGRIALTRRQKEVGRC